MSCADLSDLLLDGSGDLVFAADDARTVTGAATAAQNIAERLRAAHGTLPWAPREGADINRLLNAAILQADLIETIVRRAALAESCVDVSTIAVHATPAGAWSLAFRTRAGEAAEVEIAP